MGIWTYPYQSHPLYIGEYEDAIASSLPIPGIARISAEVIPHHTGMDFFCNCNGSDFFIIADQIQQSSGGFSVSR